jgi:hypothetical protein
VRRGGKTQRINLIAGDKMREDLEDLPYLGEKRREDPKDLL